MGDNHGAQVPVVPIGSSRDSPLGEAILQEFEQRCSQLLQRILEQREDASDADESAVEVEARIGVYNDEKRAFQPGVKASFFNGMRGYLEKKAKRGGWMRADNPNEPVGFERTDLLDVTFEDGIRVTCELDKGSSGTHVRDVRIVEAIVKRKLGRARDFKVSSKQLGDAFHLRLGVACEDQVAPDSERFKKHAAAARKAVMDALNVSTSVKILGGIETSLGPSVEFVYIQFPPDAEMAARGRMRFTDPLYELASNNDGKVSGDVARQLKWTLLQPARLPGLEGKPNTELRDLRKLENHMFLTNHPGVLVLPDGSRYAVYACQYVIEVKKEFILCGRGRFANPSAEGDGASGVEDLPIKLFRRKRRWSFELRHHQRLDMTETFQSTNLNDIYTNKCKPVYEVELEKLLSSSRCRERSPQSLAADLRAVHHADALLADIASRIYGQSLPPLDPDKLPSERWAQARQADQERKARLVQEIARMDGASSRAGPSHGNEGGAGAGAGAGGGGGAGMDTGQDGGAEEDNADQAGAADFYNNLNRSSQASRHESLIYHMRCLNNFVKSVVIKECIAQVCAATQRGPQAPLNVLDLACGKGADVQKFIRACKELSTGAQLGHYVGVDIARKSLEDAVKRLETMREKPHFVHLVEADLGKEHLSAQPGDDCDIKLLAQWDSSTATWDKRPPSQTVQTHQQFELVSMQFALHYMFQSRQRAMHFFKTISKHMAIGARFISTTVHADEMIRRLMEAGPGASAFSIRDDMGVETCRVEFDPDFRARAFRCAAAPAGAEAGEAGPDPADPDTSIGVRYLFTLRDGSDDSQQAVAAPEWLVPPQLLVKLAAVFCLKLTRYEPLPNAAARHMQRDDPGALYRHMNVLNHEGTISDAEWNIASLYVIVELEKEAGPSDYMSALRYLKQRIPSFGSLSEEERSELLKACLAHASI